MTATRWWNGSSEAMRISLVKLTLLILLHRYPCTTSTSYCSIPLHPPHESRKVEEQPERAV